MDGFGTPSSSFLLMLIGMQLRRDADYSGGTVLCGGTLCSSVKIVKAEAFFSNQKESVDDYFQAHTSRGTHI